MNKKTVQEVFGQYAESYVNSAPHAKGASLARLVAVLEPCPEWQVLDVATGAGHTAFAIAPHVARVLATDITPEMLALVEQGAAERELSNVSAEHADADALPYAQESFDLVTCRIAAHHFPNVGAFVSEAVRVLKPGGRLAVVDNIVPEGIAGDYVNAFDKLRDPSHGRCLSKGEWLELLKAQGLKIVHDETLDKPMKFSLWTARHDENTQRFLKSMLSEGNGEAISFLRPQQSEGDTVFHLLELLVIAQKARGV